MNKKFRNNILCLPYTIWMVGFIIIPLLFIIYYAMTKEAGTLTFDNIKYFFNDIHRKSFVKSLNLALTSTIICIILAYPIALIFRNSKTSKTSFIIYLFILPMWLNGLLRIYAWLTLIEKNGIINLMLSFLHLPNISIVNTNKAIVLGMVYDFLPFMILPLYNSLMKIKEDTLNAARDLGASELTVFVKIILPLSVPGIVSGVAMVFIPALTTVAISDILGGGSIFLIGNVIEQEFLSTMNWHLGSGISFVLVIFVLVVMGITNIFADDDNNVVMS